MTDRPASDTPRRCDTSPRRSGSHRALRLVIDTAAGCARGSVTVSVSVACDSTDHTAEITNHRGRDSAARRSDPAAVRVDEILLFPSATDRTHPSPKVGRLCNTPPLDTPNAAPNPGRRSPDVDTARRR